MKKKWLCMILGTAMVEILAGCGQKSLDTQKTSTTAEADNTENISDELSDEYSTTDMPEVTLVYAEVNPLDTIAGQMATDFKNKVEELSDGKIIIEIEAGGVLGSENEVLDAMLSSGIIDMSRISAFSLTNYGGQKSMLLSLPYTFVSRDHFWNFATSDLAKEFLMEPQENGFGVRGLFYGEEGFRHFFTVKEIAGLDNLKGMKLRVSNDPIMNGLVEGLGAFPAEISFNELYSALQSGMADGAEQPIANYKSNAFQEVAPNLILDGHTLGAVQVIITDAAWNKLTSDQQAIIMEAGEFASRQNRINSEVKEKEALEQLKSQGVNIIEVNDIAPWQEAAKKVIEDHTKGYEELYQQILNMR